MSTPSAQPTSSNQEVSHEITLFAEPVFSVGNFTITNSLLNSWIAVLILIVISVALRKSIKEVPRGIQNVFEIVVEGALSLCDQVTNDRKISKRVFPVVFAIFCFILVNNWLGILPGVGSIGFIVAEGGKQTFVPYLRGATADINTTLALAVFAVIGANVFGILSIGLWKMFNKFFNFQGLGQMFTKARKDPTILIVAPINFAVGLIELVGELAKIASLSFRLFGNVFAGEVLLAAMAAIFAFVLPVPFLFLEIMVGFIQALIFGMLTLVYFTIAAQDHSHEEEHAPDAAH